MKDEIKDYSGSVKSYSYGDLHIPKEAIDEIMEASAMLKKAQRNDKIDKLLNESK